MTQQTKPPNKPRRVMLDDFTVEEDGVTYYPHAGEYVEYKGRPSLGLYLALQRLGETDSGMELLLGTIADWTLTDDDGKPYTRPSTVEDLTRLPREELGWLIAHTTGSVDPNASTGST